jgi:hypothetical protein
VAIFKPEPPRQLLYCHLNWETSKFATTEVKSCEHMSDEEAETIVIEEES